jgi:hypothetical protein
MRLRGGVKPGHFRGRTFSKSDSKRDGRGCLQWRFTQRFDGLSLEEQARGGASLWAEPGYDRQDVPVFGATRLCRSKAPERPKLGLLVPLIDAILEADKTAPPKQRHTAKRIFERLRIEHGYAGGYTVVKDYVRIARARSREVFVPLAIRLAMRRSTSANASASSAACA